MTSKSECAKRLEKNISLAIYQKCPNFLRYHLSYLTTFTKSEKIILRLDT